MNNATVRTRGLNYTRMENEKLCRKQWIVLTACRYVNHSWSWAMWSFRVVHLHLFPSTAPATVGCFNVVTI
ncbi:unnamed protein product [Victoria cruziana]